MRGRQARAARWQKGAGNGGARTVSHIESLLGQLPPPGAGLVTVLDDSSAALSWLGGV